MSNHAILDPEGHRDLRIRTGHDELLGDGVMSCFTTPDEFRRLQNDFPILFRREAQGRALSALALLGFEAGENLYLDGDHWRARVKPLSLAVQPFLVGRPAKEGDDLQLHIDLDHPRIVSDGSGTRLFDDQGHPTGLVDEAMGMLGALDAGYRLSADFFDALERHQLIEPFALDIELSTGVKHRMVGYELINEDRLAALEPWALGELHAAGLLTPIFMAIASLANLIKLIEWKHERNG